MPGSLTVAADGDLYFAVGCTVLHDEGDGDGAWQRNAAHSYRIVRIAQTHSNESAATADQGFEIGAAPSVTESGRKR